MHCWHTSFIKFAVCIPFLILSALRTFAGNEPDYDEVSPMLSVQVQVIRKCGVLYGNDVAYLSVTDVFDF